MNKTKCFVGKTVLITLIVTATIIVYATANAGSNLWFCNDENIDYLRIDWMKDLNDDLLVSEISIPGTHDAMARFGGPAPRCHTLTLIKQLNAGIRAFDIRCRHIEDVFAIHHGAYFQNAFFGSDVLDVCIQFLRDNPSETILMRVKKEYNDHDNTRSFEGTFEWYKQGRENYIWSPDDFSVIPSLGEVRGKIVILQNFASVDPQGLSWGSFHIQDDYKVYWTHASMDGKGEKIYNHFYAALHGFSDEMYINFTSGSTGMNPVDVARGIWIPFKYEEGMNERTYRYLKLAFDQNLLFRCGTVMMDFPGPGLIDIIIAQNHLPSFFQNNPPAADAGGPYEGDEAAILSLDASASADADGDPLQYRWDFDNDGNWDSDWSDNSATSHIWYDDYEGLVLLEVRDIVSGLTDYDIAFVNIKNVIPAVVIDSVIANIRGFILPGMDVHFYGSFSDPGHFDTHFAEWDFSDNTTIAGNLEQENNAPDATGTISDIYIYETTGIYHVVLAVTDDDDGEGTASADVRVLTVKEALDFIKSYINDLPENCFRKPAENRKNAFSNKIDAVSASINNGHREDVFNKLENDVRAKFDGHLGGNPKNDWIKDFQAQQDLCYMVDELIIYLSASDLKNFSEVLYDNSILSDGDSIVTDVSDGNDLSNQPLSYMLSQNYPNPFNPLTVISFSLPSASDVRLDVMNIVGQKVATLIDRLMEAGRHSVTWDASEHASGVYFYRIEVGEFVETRKMILVK